MSKYRNIIFTSYEVKEPVFDQDIMAFMIYQLEEGNQNHRLHYQGYIEFKGQETLKDIKKILGQKVHIEPRKGSQQQAIDYCKKVETRIGQTMIFGKPKFQGSRSDLDSIIDAIESGMTQKEILKEFRGNALRHINMINKAMSIYWDKDDIDKEILEKRNFINNMKISDKDKEDLLKP